MAYCVVGDVQKLFANVVFSGSSPVTTTDITSVHIPKADALIDARLRGFYDVPIAASGDLELLRLISMNLTAGFVADILYETSAQPSDSASVRRHREWGEGLLEQVARGELTLATERKAVADGGVETEPLMRMGAEF